MGLKLFRQRVSAHRRASLANVLHNQRVISGIGNYLRSDILWTARLSPSRTPSTLTDDEWKALYDAVRSITRESYEAGGTAAYQASQGHYEPIIYKKEHDPLGNPIQFKKFGSQNVFWVPKLQK
jgi:endonuclease-8